MDEANTESYYCVSSLEPEKILKEANYQRRQNPFDTREFTLLFLRKTVFKQHHGTWGRVSLPLFPGYLFLRSTWDVQEIREFLRDLPTFSYLLRYADGTMRLRNYDYAFATRTFAHNGLFGPSKLVLHPGAKATVLSGPLKGREGIIRRIDRHGRKVWVDIPIMDHIVHTTLAADFLREDMLPNPVSSADF